MARDSETTAAPPGADRKGKGAGKGGDTVRERRLADALRENLHRRKRQIRGRAVRADKAVDDTQA